MSSRHKLQNSIEQRIMESTNIIRKYPDRVPVICEKNEKNTDLQEMVKSRLLVPKDLTLGHLISVIRNKLKLSPSYSLFITIQNMIPASTTLMSELYDEYSDPDGFLYITYSQENTFGK